MDPGGKGEGGVNYESTIETYTLHYAKQIDIESLMYNAGLPKLVICDNLEGWGGEEGGRRVQDGGDKWMPMANLY